MWEIVANIKISTKHKILFIVLVILVFFALEFVKEIIEDRQKMTYEFLVKFADENNNNLPMVINSDLRFDSTMALKWNKFAFYYSIYTHSLEDFDIKDFEENLKPFLLSSAKKIVEENVFFKDLKINMVYIFRDKNGNEIKNIEISYKDYE